MAPIIGHHRRPSQAAIIIGPHASNPEFTEHGSREESPTSTHYTQGFIRTAYFFKPLALHCRESSSNKPSKRGGGVARGEANLHAEVAAHADPAVRALVPHLVESGW